jgi:hypothetical protein
MQAFKINWTSELQMSRNKETNSHLKPNKSLVKENKNYYSIYSYFQKM